MNFLSFKNSVRFLQKSKRYLVINILGLGVGTASFILLFLYVYNDMTYDLFNEKSGQVYHVMEFEGLQTKGPLLPVLLNEVPEIKDGTRIFNWEELRLSYGDVAFPENIQYVDTGFFNLFSFPFVEGNPDGALEEKFSTVISEDFASKYFGNTPALGKKLRTRFDNTFLTISGVVKIPDNSSVKFDIITSYKTGETISPWIKDVHDWYNTFSETYILLGKDTEPESLYPKFKRIVKENFIPVGENNTEIRLLPLKDLHDKQASNKTLIIILMVIALAIIGIAIINFINLTLANSLTRYKEMSVKKVIGARRFHLFGQLMSESLIISFLAMILGLAIAYLALPYFNEIFEINLTLNPFNNLLLIPVLLMIWLITGVLSGIIPSLFWVRVKLINALKGQINMRQSNNLSRYWLIIFQFAITIILIAGGFFIQKQIDFMMSKDTNFDKENVVVAYLDSWKYEDQKVASRKFEIIADELKANPIVKSVSFSVDTPGQYNENYNSFYPEEWSKVERASLRQVYVSEDYFKTYGIEFLEGRPYDPFLSSDSNAVIINKAAMKKFGVNNIAGSTIHTSSSNGYPHKIIGVVDDYYYQGLQREIQPLIHFTHKRENLADWNCLSVRAESGSTLDVIKLLKQEWNKVEPSSELNYFFASDKLNEHYKEYIKINTIVGYFTVLAILLSCMGLFAISSFAMARKTKEIGIRKVNGAKVWEVITMLNRDFVIWVSIAFLIATPLAWFTMDKWLESFAYKTELSWWIFALAGMIAVGIALLTVSWQSWKAATRNPVEALRYE